MGNLMTKIVRALKTRSASQPPSTPAKPHAAPRHETPPRALGAGSHSPRSAAPTPADSHKGLGLGCFTYENLLRAWRKVKANGGAAGVDGQTLREFERNLRGNLEALARELRRGEYQPQPVRRVYVPKLNDEWRPLAILTVRDRITQRALYDAIAPLYERKFLDCSFGFREGRSLHDAIAVVAQERDEGKRWVVDGDIKDCFEQIDHRLLMQMLARDVHDRQLLWLIEQWLGAQVFNDLRDRKPNVGTFQGGVISPLLANIYLHAFDVELTQAGLTLLRYADDWIILTSKKTQAEAALEQAARALERLRLAINPYKTRVVNFDQGFTFLGVFFVRNEYFYLAGAGNQVDKETGRR